MSGGSTGQLLGAVVGAAVAYFSGGNVALGWTVGSLIGGAIDPQKIEGPRLDDRKVQVSTYGASIPILYGGTAVAGNVIWSTDLVEHAVESDGKGGPTVVTHTYSVSCAILIGEGPIAGIRRIWADAKLIYDTSAEADTATQLASLLLADYFVFYTGSETQLPDPTIEAALGVGNVPAYLGSCYIVFTDIPLADYGNRLPNFRFETSEGETEITVPQDLTYEPLKIYPWSGDRPVASRGVTEFHINSPSADFEVYEDAVAYSVANVNAFSDLFIGYSTSANGKPNRFTDGADIADDPQYVTYKLAAEEPDVIVNTSTSGISAYCVPMQAAGATTGDGANYWTIDIFGSWGYIVRLTCTSDPPGDPWNFLNNCINYPFNVDCPGNFPIAIGNQIADIRAERQPALPPDVAGCPVGDPCLLGQAAELPGDDNYCYSCDGEVTPNGTITYTLESGTFKQLAAIEYRAGVLYQNGHGPVLLPGDPNYDNADYWNALATAAIAAGTLRSDWAAPAVVSQVAKGTRASVGQLVADEANTTLDVIVSDICMRAGMSLGSVANVNVTALEGIVVQGYSIPRQMPARTALLPLQQTFWWDFVESGREIKAVLRGGDPVVTIGVNDLGATEGADSLIPVLPNRAQETELPATVNVAYPVRATGYETGTQRARRVVTGSQQVVSLELAVVMTDERAAQVADVMMYASWTNRTERQWSTTREYAKYEPTDLMTLNDGEFEYVCRVTERSEEGGCIKWRGVDELPAAYLPNVSPGVGGGTIGGVRFDGPMKLELIDSPILMDSNDDAGMYAAAAGYRSTYPGGTAFRSSDGGVSYVQAKTMNASATIGYAATVLGDWTGGNMADETNSVNIRMHSGTLAGVTYAQLLGNANYAILGDELIQFRGAELVSAGIYRLTGLLRGRRGTEQHMGTHVVDERFVLMNANTVYRLDGSLGDIDAEMLWKGVTFGQTLDDALAQPFTNTGAGIKPLSAVHVFAGGIGGGEFTVQWVRRSRIGGEWRDGVDVPLGETTQSYEIDVLSGSTVLSSYTSVTPTVDVTAVAGNTVKIYQMSSSIGRGFPATITL